ncbi:MAG TPA: ABC transporter substrate-binding protein [Stellaceae bacterium]|nr:ABC transporter substrate-binding protein [Stellaceae bacterium]
MTPLARLVRFAAALAVLIALAAAHPPPAAAQQTLRLAYLRALTIIPVLDAEQMGYLKKEGLKVELITLNNGPAVVSAVVGGSADIGWAATLPAISAIAQHQPIRAFLTNDFQRWPDQMGTYMVASARSGVKTLAGLKGKTIANNATNGGCDLMIRDQIRAAGIPATAMKMVVLPFPQMKAALELGTVDAVCTIDPFYAAIMHSPQIKPTLLAEGMVANLKQLGSFAVDCYFARADWLDKNKAPAAAFMRALMAADKDLAAHPQKYHQMIVKEFGLPVALANAIPLALNTTSMVAEAKDYKPPIDALVRTGLMAKPIPPEDVVFTIKP